MTPAELDGLIERLQALFDHRGDGVPTQLVNPDGPDAATAITQLRAENERLWEGLEKIEQGDIDRPIGKRWREDGKASNLDSCIHDISVREGCGNCISDFARSTLSRDQGDG